MNPASGTKSSGVVRTPVRRQPAFDFSVTGLIYCATMMLMGVAAINGQVNLLFGIFGLMCGTLLVSILICRMVLARLTATRRIPEQCFVGRPATIVYQIKNRKRIWPSLSVTLTELEGNEAFEAQPTAYMLHAGGGDDGDGSGDADAQAAGKIRAGGVSDGDEFSVRVCEAGDPAERGGRGADLSGAGTGEQKTPRVVPLRQPGRRAGAAAARRRG